MQQRGNQVTSQEEADFRLWARQNYVKFSPIQGTWHPIVQDECVAMNRETGYSFHWPTTEES